MIWSEPKPPTEGESFYDHIKCQTPIGTIKIEWKSWKDSPDYGIEIENEYVGTEYNLEDAKERARKYLEMRYKQLEYFLYEE